MGRGRLVADGFQKRLFKKAIEAGASDIHLQGGRKVVFRVHGSFVRVGEGAITSEQLQAQIREMLPKHLKSAELEEVEAAKGLDFSFTDPEAGRFRCSAFMALGQPGMTMRSIRANIPSIEQLHLPTVVMDIALSRRGLTLVTGTTGSGKSTTLAVMIALINSNYDAKIITVEDPVEYMHSDNRALITQIEVGSDSISFDQALRQALRQDPDVIMIGELRDVETLRMALRAADTGHQVFATVHASRAAQTIERIIAMFPADEHKVLFSYACALAGGDYIAAACGFAGGRCGAAGGGGDFARRASHGEIHHGREANAADGIH